MTTACLQPKTPEYITHYLSTKTTDRQDFFYTRVQEQVVFMSLYVCTLIPSLLAWKAYFFFLIIAVFLLIMTAYKNHHYRWRAEFLLRRPSPHSRLQTLRVTLLHHLPSQSPQAVSSPSSASYILWGSMGHLFKHGPFMSSHRLFLCLGAFGNIDLTHKPLLMAWLKLPFVILMLGDH